MHSGVSVPAACDVLGKRLVFIIHFGTGDRTRFRKLQQSPTLGDSTWMLGRAFRLSGKTILCLGMSIVVKNSMLVQAYACTFLALASAACFDHVGAGVRMLFMLHQHTNLRIFGSCRQAITR